MKSHPIKAFREKQKPKLSQERLALLLGVARTTVARWETGTRKVDEEKLSIVASHTGISPGILRPDLAKLMKSKE